MGQKAPAETARSGGSLTAVNRVRTVAAWTRVMAPEVGKSRSPRPPLRGGLVRASQRLIVLPVAISLVVPALLMAGATPAFATPANDAFAAPQTISGAKGVTYGTLVGATIDSGTTCGEPPKRSGL